MFEKNKFDYVKLVIFNYKFSSMINDEEFYSFNCY